MKTRHEWIASLATASPVIKAMQLDQLVPDGTLDQDGYNLANDEKHCALLVRSVDNLLKRPSASSVYVKDILKELTYTNPYGSFNELAAYDWILRQNLQITAQISLISADVLGDNGATPDGVIDYCGIYFDIKSFGFHGYLARRLKERLEQELNGRVVFIEESWDLPVETFQKLIADARNIAKSLQNNNIMSFGRLRIRAEHPKTRSRLCDRD